MRARSCAGIMSADENRWLATRALIAFSDVVGVLQDSCALVELFCG